MSHVLKYNVADQIAYFRAYDTDGTAKTDLDSSTTGLTLSVFRVGASSVSIASLSDKAADDSTHADGAIRSVGGNLYTIDIPDAATATQVPSIVVRGSYTGGVVEGLEHPVVAYNPATAYSTVTNASVADAVYDEAYAGHTTPGTYGFLWDKWRKSNPAITGEVTSAVTPTTTTFSTDITGYADTAFDNAVLVFINGSTNADFRGVVSGYLQANGQVTITPALPQAPVAGDEFVIAITSFVYTTTQTQSGLATSAGVTAAFTEIKGATWDSGTDTLEAIRNASGGGSGVSALLPAIGVVPVRVDQTMLTAFVGETIDVAIVVYQSDGTTPMDLSGKTLEVCFESTSTTDVAVVSNANITVSGDDSNIVTFAYPSAVTGSVANYHWSLRDASAPKTVWQYGTLYVKRAALKD